MTRRRIADLYCGAGMGLYRAGFEVVGFDIEPQPNYPFEFHQMDAFDVDLSEFDTVWASPPCQAYSKVQSLGKARNGRYPATHPDLVHNTRGKLNESQLPYIIENVVGAPLINPIVLCGWMFGLKTYRHREFESPTALAAPAHIKHPDKCPSAGRGLSPNGFISIAGTGGVTGLNSVQIIEHWSNAMGIDWMTRYELSQAIPPAYSEYLGKQLMEAI